MKDKTTTRGTSLARLQNQIADWLGKDYANNPGERDQVALSMARVALAVWETTSSSTSTNYPGGALDRRTAQSQDSAEDTPTPTHPPHRAEQALATKNTMVKLKEKYQIQIMDAALKSIRYYRAIDGEAMKAKLRPSYLYKPTLNRDGNRWCALYGENLQEGIAGFGDTPGEAMLSFDRAWRTPVKVPAKVPVKESQPSEEGQPSKEAPFTHISLLSIKLDLYNRRSFAACHYIERLEQSLAYMVDHIGYPLSEETTIGFTKAAALVENANP